MCARSRGRQAREVQALGASEQSADEGRVVSLRCVGEQLLVSRKDVCCTA